MSLLAFSTALFAEELLLPPYHDAKPPALSLPAAYHLALTALGSSTNQLHCVSAGLYGGSSPGWIFTFCSTNTPPQHRWLGVQFDDKVIEIPGNRL